MRIVPFRTGALSMMIRKSSGGRSAAGGVTSICSTREPVPSKNPITTGAWMAINIHHVHDTNRWLYFDALGKENNLYPYAAQLYRIKLDGSGLQRLTKEDAAHEIRISETGSFIVDTYSMRDIAPVTVLRHADGRVLKTLEEADISQLEAAGWSPGEPFSVKSRDGVTNLYGFLYRPSNFDPEKKYPIIDYIYPGPQIGPVRYRGFTASPGGNAQTFSPSSASSSCTLTRWNAVPLEGVPRCLVRGHGR